MPVLARIVGRGDGDRIVYRSDALHPRHGAHFRAFDPLDFIAEGVAHIPDSHEKTRIFYGWYSAKTRAWRRKEGLLPSVPKPSPAADSDRAPLSVRRSWARLIKKVYEADPLVCAKCGATMRVVAFLDDPIVVRGILEHLKLANTDSEPARAPPPIATPAPREQDEFFPDPPWEDIAESCWPEDDQAAGQTSWVPLLISNPTEVGKRRGCTRGAVGTTIRRLPPVPLDQASSSEP